MFAHALQQHQSGRVADAMNWYRRILAADPGHADSLQLFGVAFHQTGRSGEAVIWMERSIAAGAPSATYSANLATALDTLGRYNDAIRRGRLALVQQPDYAGAENTLASALRAIGRVPAAVAAACRAICLDARMAEAHCNLGAALFDAQASRPAAEAFRKALVLRPEYHEVHNNLGRALIDMGNLAAAVTSIRRAVTSVPRAARVHNNLGCVLSDLGAWDEALVAFRDALRHDPRLAAAHSNLVMSLHYIDGIDQAAVLAESCRYAERIERHESQPVFATVATPGRRLKIGYVSGDFRRHPVGYFLAPVLAAHDRAAVEVHCYSNNVSDDVMTARLRASAVHWRNVCGLDDDAAAAMIRADGIDILVDLAGHTARNRLPVFARRPAPVQVSWLGYWATTGLSTIDYLITDAVTVPPGEERWYSERVVRLPGGRFCYAPPDDAPEPSPLPPEAGTPMFGSFNNLSKVTPTTVRLWAEVLKAVPGARLLLKWTSLADAGTRQRVQAAFAEAGVDPARLLLRGRSAHAAMLAKYGDIDVALDPVPFSGGLTSVEALWMGVPVVTLPADTAPSRQTAGLLRILGLDDLVAKNAADYVRIAAGLAADQCRLAAFREGLRARMAASPLCDGAAYTRGLEAVYREIWRQYCEAAGQRRGG